MKLGLCNEFQKAFVKAVLHFSVCMHTLPRTSSKLHIYQSHSDIPISHRKSTKAERFVNHENSAAFTRIYWLNCHSTNRFCPIQGLDNVFSIMRSSDAIGASIKKSWSYLGGNSPIPCFPSVVADGLLQSSQTLPTPVSGAQ